MVLTFKHCFDNDHPQYLQKVTVFLTLGNTVYLWNGDIGECY